MKLHNYLVGAVLASLGQAASAGLLMNENFNDNAATYSATWGGDSSAGAINIRAVADAINTGTNTGFDSYFGSSFLVLGDRNLTTDTAGLAGDPDGAGLSTVKFDLGTMGTGSQSLRIQFDFAFDTTLAPGTTGIRSPDDFVVELRDASDAVLVGLVNFGDVSRNEASRRGSVDTSANFNLAAPTNVYLTFTVTEALNNGNSAAGIDNIVVETGPSGPGQVVPEPASLALFGLGIAGLAASSRRRKAD
jgi:PEP-CTERM motif